MQHPYIISQQSPSHTDRGEESISSAVRVMAFRRRSWLPLALALVLLSCIAATAMAKRTGELTVFWGRNKAEGTLRAACDTGLYNTVIISFFSVFGHGRYDVDLSGHPLAGVGAEIKHCQSKGIPVFLSICGAGNGYSLPSSPLIFFSKLA